MIYVVTGLVLFLVFFLFKARGLVAVLLSERSMRAGDYDGALRTIRWASLGIPNVATLHKQGLVLSLAGRPAEAAACYREAIGMARGTIYPVERLHACRGYALMDLGRYDEAEECFHEAIEAGDHTGNSQDGLAEIRLLLGREPGYALSYANQAIQHAARRPGGRVPGSYYAHQAWALALLDRREEAREALDQALRAGASNARGSASLHWRVGMVLLAMERVDEARTHFQIGAEADPGGKYGGRCREHYCTEFR